MWVWRSLGFGALVFAIAVWVQTEPTRFSDTAKGLSLESSVEDSGASSVDDRPVASKHEGSTVLPRQLDTGTESADSNMPSRRDRAVEGTLWLSYEPTPVPAPDGGTSLIEIGEAVDADAPPPVGVGDPQSQELGWPMDADSDLEVSAWVSHDSPRELGRPVDASEELIAPTESESTVVTDLGIFVSADRDPSE